MAKYDRDVLNMPVDVIDNGTRKHWETRQEAIANYLEAMIFCEGSAKERYATIYSGLKYGSDSVVSDGEPEIVKKDIVTPVKDTAQLLEKIMNDELSINNEEVYDMRQCKLVDEDRVIIKALLKQDGCYAAQFLRNYIKNDKDLIMCASLGGNEPRGALAYASEELRDDKEFVMQLLKLDASDVRHVSDRLSNDPEIIAAALKHADNDYDIAAVKEALGENLLTEMLDVYLAKQKEQKTEITAKFDFSKVSDEKLDKYYVETFDTAEEMFNDLYLFDADHETLRDAIRVLKQQDMHSAVVSHMNVRFDGEKYYYSSEMEEFERIVLEEQKNSLEDKIAEARDVGRDKEGTGSMKKGNDKDIDR